MADKADIATEIQERHLESALASRPRWIGINIAANDECDDCGDEIPAARREAAPWATACIECQGIREQQAKHRRACPDTACETGERPCSATAESKSMKP